MDAVIIILLEYREEPVHIAWSSSESEPSDCEDKSPPPRTVVTPKQCQSQPQHKPRLNVSSYLQLLNSEAGRHSWSLLHLFSPQTIQTICLRKIWDTSNTPKDLQNYAGMRVPYFPDY